MNKALDISFCRDDRRADPHFSVDCVLIGFDGEQLCVLLVRQAGADLVKGEVEYKLPGSLIYIDEEFDDAAHRVMEELTGLRNIELHQFHTFGSPARIQDPKDRRWLGHFYNLQTDVTRLISVAYTALIKIEHRHQRLSDTFEACWLPVEKVGPLAFDHNQILREALRYIRQRVAVAPAGLFSLLPRKFTAAQLRRLLEVVNNREYDIRNFHKFLATMKYVVATDEKEEGVAHRAARYFKFDRTIYNKTRK